MASKLHFKKPTKEVSERMRKVRSRGTKLEEAMENILKELHVKYEKQPNLVGHPDFRINGTNMLIFCDSSFWHGRRKKEITGRAFRMNKRFWKNKLVENRRRDQQINRALRRVGWSVWRFWDTDILKKSERVKNRLRSVINEAL